MMKKLKLNQLFLVGVVTVVLGRTGDRLAAQGPPGGGNFDPQQIQQQMQQRMMGYFREQLAVTNDDEWSVIESRLSKVVQARMETMLGGLGGFRGMMGGNRGGDNQAGGRRGVLRGFGQPNPDADALQKAIDSNASAGELKAALSRYRESKDKKQAELTRAQDQLRQVLSLRQEAVLVSMGLLD
jgi:hypothetical protein